MATRQKTSEQLQSDWIEWLADRVMADLHHVCPQYEDKMEFARRLAEKIEARHARSPEYALRLVRPDTRASC